jgi:hypothetical protein
MSLFPSIGAHHPPIATVAGAHYAYGVSDDRSSVLNARFADFAALCEHLAGVASRLRRAWLVADYLRGLSGDEAEVATRWLTGRAFPEGEGRRLSASGRTVWDALRTLFAQNYHGAAY